jgi:hypothetical protein
MHFQCAAEGVDFWLAPLKCSYGLTVTMDQEAGGGGGGKGGGRNLLGGAFLAGMVFIFVILDFIFVLGPRSTIGIRCLTVYIFLRRGAAPPPTPRLRVWDRMIQAAS